MSLNTIEPLVSLSSHSDKTAEVAYWFFKLNNSSISNYVATIIMKYSFNVHKILNLSNPVSLHGTGSTWHYIYYMAAFEMH